MVYCIDIYTYMYISFPNFHSLLLPTSHCTHFLDRNCLGVHVMSQTEVSHSIFNFAQNVPNSRLTLLKKSMENWPQRKRVTWMGIVMQLRRKRTMINQIGKISVVARWIWTIPGNLFYYKAAFYILLYSNTSALFQTVNKSMIFTALKSPLGLTLLDPRPLVGKGPIRSLP